MLELKFSPQGVFVLPLSIQRSKKGTTDEKIIDGLPGKLKSGVRVGG